MTSEPGGRVAHIVSRLCSDDFSGVTYRPLEKNRNTYEKLFIFHFGDKMLADVHTVSYITDKT